MPPISAAPASSGLPAPPIRSSERLGALLKDLGPQLRRGGELRIDAPSPLPCGLLAVDALLGGGFPGGRISEIVGPVSSGCTSLALALLAVTTRRAGELVAVVDHADAFDPLSAHAAGVDLDRVLWARVAAPVEAQRCTRRLLETEGIPLTLLDLRSSPRGFGSTTWLRLARLAAGTRSALVVLGRERSVGPQAEVVLEMQPARPRFGDAPTLLESVEFEARLVRSRAGPEASSARFAGPSLSTPHDPPLSPSPSPSIPLPSTPAPSPSLTPSPPTPPREPR